MWFRVAATAIAVWCVSGAAMAGGYTEVWNLPEASAHGKHGAGTGQSVRDGKGASKTATKTAGKHATSGVASGSASASAAGRAEKSSKHGGVKHVTATGANKASDAAGGKAKQKAAVVAQGTKARAHVVQTQPGQSKAMRADTVQNHAADAGPINDAGSRRSAAGTSAGIEPRSSAPVTNAGADQTAAAGNPATARSGSLPPILH
ncbi:hypothetical protein [Paraburkholderia kirstenboschensis]|uniref:Uncharacterized protein n=1 Tax=Paraburkholderia kirstenboschensis TaxID=1245436 RepID=A0ABZ0EEE8_9BURK|nr:hypothetical protein [Paraburkholderia kirstenboschensis]WOD14901.1 hypothetical protein RW095_16270 [Paraburkholderia kirstenboschensis]